MLFKDFLATLASIPKLLIINLTLNVLLNLSKIVGYILVVL